LEIGTGGGEGEEKELIESVREKACEMTLCLYIWVLDCQKPTSYHDRMRRPRKAKPSSSYGSSASEKNVRSTL
jgi:hypothetical protein